MQAMRYKEFTWPNNPARYTLSCERLTAVHKMPMGSYCVQDLGRSRTVLRGAGEFFGTRQHGEPQMPALMLTGDVRLLERTRQTFLQISRQAAYRDVYRVVLEAANRRFARSGQFLARN